MSTTDLDESTVMTGANAGPRADCCASGSAAARFVYTRGMRISLCVFLAPCMALACTANPSPNDAPSAISPEKDLIPPAVEPAVAPAVEPAVVPVEPAVAPVVEPAVAPVVAPVEASQVRPVPWTKLRIWEAELNPIRPESLYITARAGASRVSRQVAWGDSVDFRPDDRRIPRPIRELSPFLVSTSRAPLRLTNPQEITLSQALYGGEYWQISFASDGLSGPLVALSHVVSPDMRLRAPAAPVVVPFEDPFVQRVASRVPRRWAESLKESEPRKLQLASGKFPSDATTIVVVSIPDELADQSVMFTAKADQTLVQELAVPKEHTGFAGITIEFIADLDGDGFDEVGWSEQDIESYRSVVTHLTAAGVEHRTLSEGGH